MERDKKVGLSLGIMLIGIVGALFFRNDARLPTEAPELRDAGAINERISQRDNAPYLVERDPVADVKPTAKSPYVPHSDPWDLPAFLRDDKVSRAPGVVATPDPIPVVPTRSTPSTTSSQPLQTAASAPRTPKSATVEYVVRRGDTLSEIAEMTMGSSAKYPRIFSLNRDRLKSPNDLRPGMKIRIPAPAASPPAEAVARSSNAVPFEESSAADDVVPPDGGRKSSVQRETRPHKVVRRKQRGLQ